MRREASRYLTEWYKNKQSKPLIIRGARQVGKSTLVTLFCKENNLDLIEFNLEIDSLSSINNTDFKIEHLLDEIQLKKTVLKKNSVLFFDEIQESPKLLKLLRYFYEKLPHIKVIAAGSLLEIALNSKDFSFPVGRIQFYHLGPMTFKEFLWATDQDYLNEKLENFEFSDEIHNSALTALRNYFYIGGMPEAVKEYRETRSLVNIRNIQSQIIQAYQVDFPKYNRKIKLDRISRIFSSLALNVGKKIIYSKLDTDSKSRDIKNIVEILIDAKVILPCIHSDGNTAPIAGESDSRIFKTYFLDIGLLGSLLNLDKDAIDKEFSNQFNFKGEIAEQFVAQHLNFFNGPILPPSLFYHLRDKGSQKAEIDFLIENNNKIFPIEVKSSAAGHLKSLKYFCKNKKSNIGIKTSLAPFAILDDFVDGSKLVNLPLYAIEYLKSSDLI